MAIDKVKEYFKPLHMEDHILEFDVSSATVELAAEALHCEEKRIAKTMSFLVGEQPILIVTAGDTCIFRKNRALAPHERSAVPLGTDHCPVG